MAPSPSATSRDELAGTVLADRYRIIKKLGEGGMGSVYLAEHTTINKRLAIKVLSPEYSHKQDLVDRFLQEARAASMIDQQNVVEITDFGSTPTGSVFFVMEFLPGEDLSDTIKNTGPLPWLRAKVIMLQICDALAAAHDAGIIHRDMKPENCFRIKRGGNEDFIKVLDFGIAKVTSDEHEGKNLTRTGMIFGTPEYMSPEQAKGEKVDHRVDVYACGVILYELLTGRVPFTADTFMGILTKHMFEAPPAPSTIVPAAQIPAEVEAIVLKAMQKDREYRFQSMRDFAEALKAVGTGSAAVSVVAESVIQPASGQIRFADRGDGNTHVDSAEDFEPRAKSSVGLYVGIGVGAVVLAGLAMMFAVKKASTDANAETPAVMAAPAVTPEPVVAPPEPKEEPQAEVDPPDTPPPQPVVTEVQITVDTKGVEATVHDERDMSVLGKAGEPFPLPKDDAEFNLVIEAEGYESLSKAVVPSSDRQVLAQLTPLPKGNKAGKGSKKRPKPRKKADAAATPATTTPDPAPEKKQDKKPEKKPEKKPTTNSDLKDPFAG